MATNISKYVQLNDFLLLEYQFSRDGETLDMTSLEPTLAITELGRKQYFTKFGVGTDPYTNNTLALNSTPTASNRSSWYVNTIDTSGYYDFFDSSTLITGDVDVPHDNIKVHIVSGYNFDDIAGFLLQLQALDTSGNLIDLSNFTWLKQVTGNDVNRFSSNTLYLGNRFYDKYVELQIPSVGELGGDTTPGIASALNISALSDVYVTYSTVANVVDNQYLIQEIINTQLPVTSVADNFNCFIANSTGGDYIEYYATWNNQIIGEYISDIESGRIPLYTSNNPNDNYESFTEQYGVGTPKWVLMHELYVYEHIPGGTTLLTQKYVFTQEDGFNDANTFRPVIRNADIASSYTIEYICRLMNRMDGTQIIRKASFASTDPGKYGPFFTRLNVENVIPYKVFNRLPAERPNVLINNEDRKQKFVKVFFDTTTVSLDSNNTVFPQGTGPLFLKKGDSVYDFKFNRINTNTDPVQNENVDLSGVFDYVLLFVLDDDTKLEITPTYSSNMNTVLGQLEFGLTGDQVSTLLNQQNNTYSIQIKNPDGTTYTFYEGLYYDFANFTEVINQYRELYDVTSLQNRISELEAENEALTTENEALKQT